MSKIIRSTGRTPDNWPNKDDETTLGVTVESDSNRSMQTCIENAITVDTLKRQLSVSFLYNADSY